MTYTHDERGAAAGDIANAIRQNAHMLTHDERVRLAAELTNPHSTDHARYNNVINFGEPSMTKIYLAARYSRNDEMRGVRDVLHGLGFEVTSRWIDLHTDVMGDHATSFDAATLNTTPERCAPIGQHDLRDLERADWVINFTCGTGGKGGRHVEFGVGLAIGKRMFVVGPRENVFHTLAGVEHFPTWRDFVIRVASRGPVTAS
jgi:hypothetical protein